MTDLERRQAEIIEEQAQKIRLLKQKVDLLVRQIYGSKSEKLDPGQLELLLGKEPEPKKDEAPIAPSLEEGGDEAGAGKKRKNRGPRLPRIPENLPVVEEIIEPEPVKGCPEAWRRIGEEISEQLDFEPGKFFRRRIVRPKYVRRADKEAPPIIAKLPEKLLERGIAAPGLLAHIAVQRYSDHLPFHRQEKIFSERHEVEIPRQSMGNWMELVADWLSPIYREIKGSMMAQGYLQVDETPVRYQAPGTGKCGQGYFWVYSVPGGDVIFDWQASRAQSCLGRVIPEDFEGILQCDGYRAYRSFIADKEGIALAGCWAHVRRKFFEAKEEAPQRAAWILRQIRHLYRIEANLREARAGPALREAARAAESRMIYKRLFKAFYRLKASKAHLPKSQMGKALNYALELEAVLAVFLEEGRVEIDNNLVENAIRPTAIGKKNWLFIGAQDTGQKSAIIYSIIGSCRRRGVEPYTYLKDVLTRLPNMTNRQIASITPEAWAREQHSASRLAS